MGAIDDVMNDLAERQHGLVARWQLSADLVGREAWRHRSTGPHWEPCSPLVLRRRGAPVSRRQAFLAAVLDCGPGAFLSHRSAAELWGLPGPRAGVVEVMVARNGRQPVSTLATVHRPRLLPDPFAAELDAIPVVRPALLVLQMAVRSSEEALRRLVDGLWSRRLLSGPSLQQELAPVLGRGRPGSGAIRRLLRELPVDYVPPASGLEGRFLSVVDAAGIGGLRRQVDLGDGERWCGRVDFVDVELPLVVEIDSERYHSALSDRRADASRQERLEQAGFVVRRITDHQVWHRPVEVVDVVRRGRRDAARLAATRSLRPSA
jgi:hypothetical protein